jgi:hypothetical protein
MATSRSSRREPTKEELAAIVAAVEAAWPRPVAASRPPAASPWRFSNRWWMPRRSVAAERQRP